MGRASGGAGLDSAGPDLFGLHDPSERRGPNYRRLSRYDVTGLIWLLHGRPIVALAADRAVIGTAGGGVTFYRMAMQND
jgi:hypothetical protein